MKVYFDSSDVEEVVVKYLQVTGVYSDDPEEMSFIRKRISTLEDLFALLDKFDVTYS